jgi:hypothetical protein
MSGGLPRIEVWRMTQEQFLYYLTRESHRETLRRMTTKGGGSLKLHVRVPVKGERT